jgi:hypothetical protein
MNAESQRSLFIALTNPMPGKDRQYNEWYTEIHLKEVVAVKGFISARRYKLSKAQYIAKQPYRYVAIYEVENGMAQGIIDNLAAAIGTMTIEPVIDLDNGAGFLAESICDTVYAPKNS